MEQKPNVGRIVIYKFSRNVLPDLYLRECPAVITRVFTDRCVNLHLLPDNSHEGVYGTPNQLMPTSVCLADSPDSENASWRWPDRV